MLKGRSFEKSKENAGFFQKIAYSINFFILEVRYEFR